MNEKTLIESIIKGTSELVKVEDLLYEAVRDLVKDEIKRYIRHKIDENPQLREEFKEAILSLIEAKAKEVSALVKIAKCSAKLGIDLIPGKIKEDILKDFLKIFEKEINTILERTVVERF